MDTLAVFRSRSEAIKFFNILKHNRLACTTVSTPAYLGLGCGMSIVFSHTLTTRVKILIKENDISTFVGFYPR